jgi:hypothetical protein
MNVDLQQNRDLKIFMKYVLPSQHVIMEFAFINELLFDELGHHEE